MTDTLYPSWVDLKEKVDDLEAQVAELQTKLANTDNSRYVSGYNDGIQAVSAKVMGLVDEIPQALTRTLNNTLPFKQHSAELSIVADEMKKILLTLVAFFGMMKK